MYVTHKAWIIWYRAREEENGGRLLTWVFSLHLGLTTIEVNNLIIQSYEWIWGGVTLFATRLNQFWHSRRMKGNFFSRARKVIETFKLKNSVWWACNYLENRNKRTKKIYNHIENGHVGYISWEGPIFMPPQCWFLRVGITKAKKIQHWEGKSTTFCCNMVAALDVPYICDEDCRSWK